MAHDLFYYSVTDYLLTIIVVLSLLFTLFLLTLPTQYQPPLRDPQQEQGHSTSEDGSPDSSPTDAMVSVQIVVLGDIGRSPRMQYHALSIASHGGSVSIIGYAESELPPELANNARIKVIPLSPSPRFFHTSNKLLFLLTAPLKVLWQVCTLYYTLAYRIPAARWMLVQNPPSIPTLGIAFFTCFLRNTILLIDWHNFGYSILALKLGPQHPLVRLSKLYELAFAKTAYVHLTVTHAMARVLKESANEEALPLHDRPASHFQPLSASQRSAFLHQLPETAPHAADIESHKTRLLVSSTSWTPDEDFSILLDALTSYSRHLATPQTTSPKPPLPRLLVIITGKGPLKEHYLSRIATLQSGGALTGITILTTWLPLSSYASLLASADLGISLHTSSSGVDLPMKVVDMFGAGLPVLGWSKFEAWPELVKEGVNGRGFGSADELCRLLVECLGDGGRALDGLRAGAAREGRRRWEEEWDRVLGRVLGFVDE